MLSLFLFYPSIRTIYLSFRDRYGDSSVGFENYIWAGSDVEMKTTLINQILWLLFVVTMVVF